MNRIGQSIQFRDPAVLGPLGVSAWAPAEAKIRTTNLLTIALPLGIACSWPNIARSERVLLGFPLRAQDWTVLSATFPLYA
jgi:hypothetical protein